ncbi:MAG: hypothetical protein WBP46_00140 [Thiolinea sp.]
MLKLLLILCLLLLAGCNGASQNDSEPPPSVTNHELAGSNTERIASISTLLAKHKPPPTTILDGYFLEEQVGDGVLGPSDYQAFYVLKVAPQDIPQWLNLLTPLEYPAQYAEPSQAREWWLDHSTFDALQFFKPGSLTGRLNGWVGISQETGHIYIFTFTM